MPTGRRTGVVFDTLVLAVLAGNALVAVALAVQYARGRRSWHRTSLLLGSALVWVGYGMFRAADAVSGDTELVLVVSAVVVSLSGVGWLVRWWTTPPSTDTSGDDASPPGDDGQ